MRKLILISTLGTLAGYAVVHFAFFSKPVPMPQEPVVLTISEPVVLAHVVEVTDTEPLLDPLLGQPVGLPFDATTPAEFTVPAAATPIPHAAD